MHNFIHNNIIAATTTCIHAHAHMHNINHNIGAETILASTDDIIIRWYNYIS